jgi:ERCC4-type nuclease
LDAISLIPGVQKKKVFNLLDEVQSSMGIDILNDYIIQDSELITYRIERVLNKSIEEYEKNNV